MKIIRTFQIITGIVATGIFSYATFSQNKVDAHQAEQEGYFTNPASVINGFVFTDNTANKIYFAGNGDVTIPANTPGCGRYFSVSPDKAKIGYKKINTDGMQLPAVLDIQTLNIAELSEPVDLCGQVSFSDNGKTAYTIGNDLYVTDGNGNIETYPLGTYSNIAPISPDGNSDVFNDDDDQLFLLSLATGNTEKITDDLCGYAFPRWSPDGSKLLYSSLPGKLKIYDVTTRNTYDLGKGSNPSWTNDSQYILFNVVSSSGSEFIGSEIFMAKFDGSEITQLTNTGSINEMFPSSYGNSVIFSTYKDQGIFSAVFTKENRIQITDTLYISPQKNELSKKIVKHFPPKNDKAVTMIPGQAPYVNQVYDTPDWHDGSGSCAPTTAIMAIGYYNRLPYWDITCSWPYTHTSHYGAYVADLYRFNELYYNTYADAYGTDAYGGYGYMWGNGSPYSYMASYLNNHDISSVLSESTTFQDVLDEIDAGYPFPLCNLLSTAGHLTLTVGYVNGQHTLIFNDPYGDKNDGSWPNYNGQDAYYDWPGYNNGYENLNTIAWTVTAESSQPVYNDTIIDDVYYNHGFYMYNQYPSHMRYFRDNATGGYNDHFWYTYTSTSTTIDTCYVTWTPNLPSDGDYEVSVYIPVSNANANTAQYKVFYNGGDQTVVIDQAPCYGEWVSLGIFPFLTGTSAYVRLGDGTGVAGQKIAFDAAKWINVTQPAAIAAFDASPTSICEGNSVQYTNTSINAAGYNWTFDGGMPSTSSQTDPMVTYSSSGTYDVILIATGPGGSDTLTMTNYITVNPVAIAGFSVSDTLVFLPSAFVTFTNTSSNATFYFWDFGDSDTSSDQNPWHNYTSAGYYTVTLIAYNAQCGNDTLVMTDCIHVDFASFVTEMNSDNEIIVGTNPSGNNFIITCELKEQGLVEAELYDVLGNDICILQKKSLQKGWHEIIISGERMHLSKGIYFLRISLGNEIFMKKIIYQK